MLEITFNTGRKIKAPTRWGEVPAKNFILWGAENAKAEATALSKMAILFGIEAKVIEDLPISIYSGLLKHYGLLIQTPIDQTPLPSFTAAGQTFALKIEWVKQRINLEVISDLINKDPLCSLDALAEVFLPEPKRSWKRLWFKPKFDFCKARADSRAALENIDAETFARLNFFLRMKSMKSIEATKFSLGVALSVAETELQKRINGRFDPWFTRIALNLALKALQLKKLTSTNF